MMRLRHVVYTMAVLLAVAGGAFSFPSVRTALGCDWKSVTESAVPADKASTAAAGEDNLTAEQRREKKLDGAVREKLASMTDEEKVAQLFIITPEALVDGVSTVTAAGSATKEALDRTPVGGFIYMGGNLRNPGQTRTMLKNVAAYGRERSGVPLFLCVDEEGGTVARIGNAGTFGVPLTGDMAAVGGSSDTVRARQAGVTIGSYLADLGFNVDFAPDADVLTNPQNTVVRRRAFGSDPQLVTAMAREVAEGLRSKGLLYSYKHFPGHGNTAGDTHDGFAYTERTREELERCELLPFQDAVANRAPFIMVGHISCPAVIGDNTPASLSPAIMTGLLRQDMGYEGLIITDALNMGAIVNLYSSSQAAVKAFLAGTDILLMPADFRGAYAGMLAAVRDGTISRERLDASVGRILRTKLRYLSPGEIK